MAGAIGLPSEATGMTEDDKEVCRIRLLEKILDSNMALAKLVARPESSTSALSVDERTEYEQLKRQFKDQSEGRMTPTIQTVSPPSPTITPVVNKDANLSMTGRGQKPTWFRAWREHRGEGASEEWAFLEDSERALVRDALVPDGSTWSHSDALLEKAERALDAGLSPARKRACVNSMLFAKFDKVKNVSLSGRGVKPRWVVSWIMKQANATNYTMVKKKTRSAFCKQLENMDFPSRVQIFREEVLTDINDATFSHALIAYQQRVQQQQQQREKGGSARRNRGEVEHTLLRGDDDAYEGLIVASKEPNNDDDVYYAESPGAKRRRTGEGDN